MIVNNNDYVSGREGVFSSKNHTFYFEVIVDSQVVVRNAEVEKRQREREQVRVISYVSFINQQQ